MSRKVIMIMMFILCMLFVPKVVLATPIIDEENQKATFSVCRSGCDNVNLDDLLTTLQDDIFDGYIVTIDFRDSTEYKILEHDITNLDTIIFTSSNNSNINISGYSANVKLKANFINVGEPSKSFAFKLTNIQIVQPSEIKNRCDNVLNCGVLMIASNAFIDNVIISSETYGLGLLRGKQFTINSYEYKGGSLGIVVGGVSSVISSFPERSINITNSKLANCDCSLVVYDFVTQKSGSGLPELNPNLPKQKSGEFFKRIANITNYNVKIDSSEVNCVKYGATESAAASNPTIYLTGSNKWFKSIKRSKDNDMSLDSLYNVVEAFNSKIIIDQNTEVSLKMSEEGDLQSYFSELKDVDPSLITWSVENNNILKIVNGKAIPLKIGNTNVTASYKNTNYTINFRITSLISDIRNPKTGSTLLLIVGLMILISALISVKFFQHNN